MSDERTIKIETTITHTDHKGQVRESRLSRVYPTSGDNPEFIAQDVRDKYHLFDGTVLNPVLLESRGIWR